MEGGSERLKGVGQKRRQGNEGVKANWAGWKLSCAGRLPVLPQAEGRGDRGRKEKSLSIGPRPR